MQLHQLHPKHKLKKGKRVGRGGKRGTYCGRGIKGQRARAGRKFKPIIREIIKKYPKLRGYRFKPLAEKPTIINIDFLEKKFKNGDLVNPQILLKLGLIRKIKGKPPEIKILGRGEIKKALIFEGCRFSKKAKEKIEKAGGQIR